MNEGDESIPSTVTRKKRRGSGFRYSSKKDLERSKVKRRIAKANGSDLASVIKALSYSRELSSGCAARSGSPHCLDIVEEHDGERLELSHDNDLIDGECPLKD
jgi:DNA-binding transcriptional MerR regulator